MPMAVNVTLAQILRLTPNAQPGYQDAFRNGQPVLDEYQISATPLRVAHFMAQVLHESAGLTIQFENLNYSPERLSQVFPSRFRPNGPLDPNDYAHNPEKFANEVYGGRMGNTGPNDGYTYRGRGLLQLTGKESYQEATRILRQKNPAAPDFVGSPDEVVSSQWCLTVAAGVWASKGCNALADLDDIRKITQAINGGEIGLAERMDWARRTKAVWV
jgi:putative chitinase